VNVVKLRRYMETLECAVSAVTGRRRGNGASVSRIVGIAWCGRTHLRGSLALLLFAAASCTAAALTRNSTRQQKRRRNLRGKVCSPCSRRRLRYLYLRSAAAVPALHAFLCVTCARTQRRHLVLLVALICNNG